MTYETLTPDQAKARIDGGWSYVDVRSVEEFAAGHAVGAYNVPVAVMNAEMGGLEPNPDFVEVMKKNFAADSELVLACAAGGRSMHACEALVAAGFSRLVNMHGGFSGARDMSGNVQQPGWQAMGYPTTVDADPERTYDALR